MLTLITAVSMYIHIISSINCVYSFELVALAVRTYIQLHYGFNYNSPYQRHAPQCTIKYFAWADQRAKVYFIFHKVASVLYGK